MKFSQKEIGVLREDNALAARLIERCIARSARVGIIGLGYVGLPLALRFAEAGFRVIGFDIDADKAAAIESGKSYLLHIPDCAVAAARGRGLEATLDVSRLAEADAIVICVPTPLTPSREPDLSFVINTFESLLPHLHTGQLVSLESTTYPGTTEEELKPRIESRGFVVGRDIFLCFSPEREDPGNPRFNTRNIPKICGGATPACLAAGVALYSQAVDQVVPVSSTRAAEMTKLLENIHRAVNIGLVNEMKIVAERMDIDIFEVIRAASTKPFGFVPYYPGPGLGGHCIPIDPHYLSWKLRSLNYFARFIDLASEINRGMPREVVARLGLILNDHRKALKGSKVLVLGVTYKRDCADTRESPAIDVIELLLQRGVEVTYHDPYVNEFDVQGHKIPARPLDPAVVAAQDAVLVITDHSDVDYGKVVQHARLVFDTRNATKKVTTGRDKIVVL
jgi:UDP-N-acetyl-D-glucosamine dehydrogenase